MVKAGMLYMTIGDDGDVWYCGPDLVTHCYGHDWQTMRGRHFDSSISYSTVRVVALAQNVEMICDIWERQQAGKVERLEVCSPLCCPSSTARSNPAVLLNRAAAFMQPGSLGGWHVFTELDLPSYQLAAMRQRPDDSDDRMLAVLVRHPAWRALSFVPSLRRFPLAVLLGEILDPRWYVSPDGEKSGRTAKLESYLGLTPRVQSLVTESARIDSSAAWRCDLVRSCWSNPPESHVRSPENFIQRAWASRGGGTRGDLSASKLFLRFLRHVWLDRICSAPFRGQLFVPSYFFQSREEVEAFQAHMASAVTP
jgi:hypothetical protein